MAHEQLVLHERMAAKIGDAVVRKWKHCCCLATSRTKRKIIGVIEDFLFRDGKMIANVLIIKENEKYEAYENNPTQSRKH